MSQMKLIYKHVQNLLKCNVSHLTCMTGFAVYSTQPGLSLSNREQRNTPSRNERAKSTSVMLGLVTRCVGGMTPLSISHCRACLQSTGLARDAISPLTLSVHSTFSASLLFKSSDVVWRPNLREVLFRVVGAFTQPLATLLTSP